MTTKQENAVAARFDRTQAAVAKIFGLDTEELGRFMEPVINLFWNRVERLESDLEEINSR